MSTTSYNRNSKIYICVTPKERNEIQNKAQSLGMKESEYIKATVLSSGTECLDTTKRTVVDRGKIGAWYVDMTETIKQVEQNDEKKMLKEKMEVFECLMLK